MHMEETMRQTSALAPHTNGPTITAGEILVEIMATTVGSGFLEPQTLIGPFPSKAAAQDYVNDARSAGFSCFPVTTSAGQKVERIN